jgi:predicted phage terminase large subunit-like protein
VPTSADELARITALPSLMGRHVLPKMANQTYEIHPWIKLLERKVVTMLHRPGVEILIVSVPPQEGKSTWCSMLLPAWYLGRNPGHQVILISYNETQASKWGRKTRDLIRTFGQQLFNVGIDPSSDAASDWTLDVGFGGMMSAGIRGGITGNPGHLIILDDTLKGAEEANSPTVKQKNIEEWDDAVTSRFQENTKVIIPATRWAEDDLSGHLIEQASRPDYNGFPVHVINIKALAEPDPEDLRAMDDAELDAWRDELGRRYGEGLAGQHSQRFFEIKRNSTPPGRWMALHQGTPTAGSSGMFPDEDWRFWVYDDHPDRDRLDVVLPEIVKKVRVWDIASSEGAGDWTVGSLFGRSADGRYFLLERERFRHGPGRVKKKVLATAERDGYDVTILIEQERSGAGPTVLDTYQQLLPGYSVKPAKAEGDKESRATPYSQLQNEHKVFLPRDVDWHGEWRKEHEQMDGKGKRPRHDDQIDTGAYAIRFLLAGGMSEIWDPSGIQVRDDMTPEQQMEILAVRELLGIA